jgi:hypothetical protein
VIVTKEHVNAVTRRRGGLTFADGDVLLGNVFDPIRSRPHYRDLTPARAARALSAPAGRRAGGRRAGAVAAGDRRLAARRLARACSRAASW